MLVLIENALNVVKRLMKALSVNIRNAGRAAPETGRSLVQCCLKPGKVQEIERNKKAA